MAPDDKFNIVYIILLIHGIGCLMAWNTFINAESYFVDYKLNVPNSSTALKDYRKNFLSYYGIASKAPNILSQLLNLFFNSNYQLLSTRIWSTFLFQTLIFIMTLVLAVIDSQLWSELFFWITIMSAIVVNVANGILQACLYGIAAKLPKVYTNAVTIGFSISGVIAALFLILSISIAPNPKTVAIYYFSFAILNSLFCFICEIFIKRNKFYIYHMENEKKYIDIDVNEPQFPNEKIEESIKLLESDSELIGWNRYLYVFKKIWVKLLNIIFIFFITFSIFPSILANIQPLNGFMSEEYFAPVFCFLFFNIFAFFGNYLAQKVPNPRFSVISIVSVLRLLFIPFFLFCNFNPNERLWPVIIDNDWIYIFVTIVLALSAGYLSSVCVMECPLCVRSQYVSTAGMMASFSVLSGITLGFCFSLLNPWFINTSYI